MCPLAGKNTCIGNDSFFGTFGSLGLCSDVMICACHGLYCYWTVTSCSWLRRGISVFHTLSFVSVSPSHLVSSAPRMESLETALQLVVPVEKASLLLCGSDLLLLHDVAVADFHFTDAGGIYQNLKVHTGSHRIVIE